MKILLATNNQGKLRELKALLPQEYEILTMKDCGIDVDVVEDGDTFEDNALIKAKTISQLSGMVTIADDSGLEVTALGGAPGIYSARYSGSHGNDNANNELLLKNMQGISDRSANFTSAVVLYYPSGEYMTFVGKVYGRILEDSCGDGGFGYDPLFYSTELNKSFGTATAEEKNRVSHRAKALAKLVLAITSHN